MVKHDDDAEIDIAKGIETAHPLSGHVVLGLKDGGISLTDFRYTRSAVTPQMQARLETLQQAIISGRISVPNTREALATWKPLPV
jgi:basic membrane lipoprotein Med (substrate-binding protein (PBP1-ABC) superfamily)